MFPLEPTPSVVCAITVGTTNDLIVCLQSSIADSAHALCAFRQFFDLDFSQLEFGTPDLDPITVVQHS